jgi:hypothetical protein
MIHSPKKTIVYRGIKLQVYGISWLAALCNRSRDRVRAWERENILPKPLLALRSGEASWRWYTAAELRGYSTIFSRSNVRPKVPIESTDFKRNAQRFRMELSAAMKINPAVLGRVFEGEATLLQVMTKRKEDKWRAEVDQIIAKV